MKKGFLIFAIIFSLSVIGLGIFGMFNSKKIENDNKPENNNPDNDVEQHIDVDKLYNYVLGFGYEFISDENTRNYYSDVHQGYKVTVDNLSNIVILRNAIKQLVECNGEYDGATLPYDVVYNKIKEVVGINVQIENLSTSMYIGVSEGGYACSVDGCIPVGGSYCGLKPLNSNYTMINHIVENDNVIIIDQDINAVQYKHTFKKDVNGNYYWISSEPVMY